MIETVYSPNEWKRIVENRETTYDKRKGRMVMLPILLRGTTPIAFIGFKDQSREVECVAYNNRNSLDHFIVPVMNSMDEIKDYCISRLRIMGYDV